MELSVSQQIELIKNEVMDFINYKHLTVVPKVHYETVVNIGTSIICTKYRIGYPGGSFVQSVVNNDLMRTFSTADATNRQYIDLYCKMLYNIPNPIYSEKQNSKV
jgi:hypothetical protein